MTDFKILYKTLNKAQKEAVDAIEGPVMVIAGPGTGKTTILTLRIANILQKTDTAPDSILALTFTESGAYAMRKKLLEIIGPSAYRVAIHTFHGFAESVIEEYPDYFHKIIGSTVITDAEQVKIIEKIVRSREVKVLRPYGDEMYYVKSVLNEIHLLKRENISPEDLKKSVKNDSENKLDKISPAEQNKLDKRDEKNLELAFVYKKYEEELAKQKYYDFDDMLLEFIRAMEDSPDFKLLLQEKHQYILADEHQDANASQNKILELLADFHESPNLFIVGDDKQAIYRFQGASLENFLYFSKKYHGAKVVVLEHNYRSHQGILDASHSLIVNNPSIPGRDNKKLISLQIGAKPIYVYEFATKDEELEGVSYLVNKFIKSGEKPEEIAILYRENKEARAMSDALRVNGIHHRVESDNNILNDIDTVKIIMLCRVIFDPSDSELLGQVLFLPEMNCNPAEVAELCTLANRERKPLYKLIGGVASLAKAYERILTWSRDARVIPFPEFLQKIIQETNMLVSIASAPNSLERLSSLENFFDRIAKAAQSKKTFYLKDFIEYVDIVSEHGLLAKHSYAEHVGGVRLMTAHRAKGLEFNHVIIINAKDGIWGNRKRRNHFSIPVIEHVRDSGRIEDERRLFYVAMTRARESVTISYSKLDGDRETVRSQFIEEIDPAVVKFEVFEPATNLPESKDSPVSGQSVSFMKKMTTRADNHSVSILEPDFVHSKFLSQAFSVTHLNNFLECPWRYFFVNLIRIPQAPTKHQMYGTAIHGTLRSFFDAYKEERKMNIKQIISLFKHNIDKQPMSVDDRRESFEKGKKALTGYFKTYGMSFNRHILSEYSVKGIELAIDGGDKKARGADGKKSQTSRVNIKDARLQLTGKIDKIEFLDDHNVTVIDYKTAKPKSRNEIEGKTRSADGNYKRQLTFYKILLDGEKKKFNMKYGEIDFIEPNERGIYKKERFEVTEDDVAELRSLISKVASQILNLSFVDSKCDDKECQYCRLGKILLSDKGVK